MTLAFQSAQREPAFADTTVFVSASIPDPAAWQGDADPLGITDAVVALARVFLTAGVTLVTAAHPTIAPLLLYVAAELEPEDGQRIATYQSELFDDVLPAATRRFETEQIGRFVWTPAAPDDRPVRGEWDASLEIMRRQMLGETQPSAAAFVGGMEGIATEHALFNELLPGRPTYPIGRPGGEARHLAAEIDSPLREQLMTDAVYPALWRRVLRDLHARQQT